MNNGETFDGEASYAVPEGWSEVAAGMPQFRLGGKVDVSGTPTIKPPVFTLVRKDHKQDVEGTWSMVVILGYTGELENHAESRGRISEEQIEDIYAAVERLSGWYLASEGGWGAGEAFAREPMIDIYPSTLIVSQYGGRDV